MKPCFKHLFCAVSAGRLENCQCCLAYTLTVVSSFNNFCPKHAIEAADTQKPSDRCGFKESGHSRALILYLPTTDKQALGKSSPAREGESGRTKTSDSKALCTGQMGLSSLSVFLALLLSPRSVHYLL